MLNLLSLPISTERGVRRGENAMQFRTAFKNKEKEYHREEKYIGSTMWVLNTCGLIN